MVNLQAGQEKSKGENQTPMKRQKSRPHKKSKRRNLVSRKNKSETQKPRYKDMILVLDFGSQYTQLIARRIRENKVYSKIVPYNIPIAEIKAMNPKGLILSGG